MSRKIVACPSCGARFDVSAFQPGSKIRCGSCYSVLRIPGAGAAPTTPKAPVSSRGRSGRKPRSRSRSRPGVAPRKAQAAPPPAPPSTPAVPVQQAPPPAPAAPVSKPAPAAPPTAAPAEAPPAPSPSIRVDDLLGRTINGDFKLVKKIGEGGYGTVYEGEDLTLQRRVAVKLMLREKTTNKEFVEKFLREARTAAQLSHPNIVKIHIVGFDRDLEQHFLAMEYVEGQTLSEIMQDEGAFSIDRALDVMVQAAHGLGEAHKKNIIHRDIKPGNIMITPKGVVKVADFGLAKVYDPGDAASTIIGTPYFMPPEQFEGKVRDGRTDIYALGVTLYYMLTLKRPFDGKTPAEVLLNIVKKDPVHPKEFNEQISDSLWAIIQKMLCRNVDERYATCEELLRDIKDYQDEGSTEEKVFCPKCGIGNPFSAEHCMECETSLLEPCPVCGTPDFVDAKFCGSCGANLAREREVVTLLGEAESHVAAGRIESAIETYESARGISEKNSKVIDGFDLAQKILAERDEAVGNVRKLLDGDDPLAAHEAAEQAMERFPGHEPLGELLARARDAAQSARIASALDQARGHLKTGDHTEALSIARRALEIDPDSEDAATVLAEAQASEAKCAEARAAAFEAEEDGLLSAALEAWTAVLSLVPEDPDATAGIERLAGPVEEGEALRQAGVDALAENDLETARSELEAAARTLPGDENILAALEDLRKAEGARRQALAGAMEKFVAGEYDECRAALTAFDEQYPGNAVVQVAMAQAFAIQEASGALLEHGTQLLEQGRPEAASAFLRAAERLAPLDGRAEEALAKVRADKKAQMEALATVRDLLTREEFAEAIEELDRLGGVASPHADVADLARQAADGLREVRRQARLEVDDDEDIVTAEPEPDDASDAGVTPVEAEGA